MWAWIGMFLLLAICYWYWASTKKVGMMEARGVKSLKPYPFVGSHSLDFFTSNGSFLEQTQRVYNRIKDWNMGVYYQFGSPVVVVNDPDLIREVAVKKFDHFTDRLVLKELNEVQTESNKLLTAITGEEWKAMRSALSPSFTTGKLKGLVQSMDATGPEFSQYVRDRIAKGEDVFEMKDLFGRFTMSMIGKAVFGINANVFRDNCEFMENAARIMDLKRMVLRLMFYVIAPKVAKAMRIRTAPLDAWNFFANITEAVTNQRKSTGGRANDMLQVLLDQREKNQEANNADEQKELFEKEAEMDIKVDSKNILTNDVISQSTILFLLAGFETTANTLSMLSYYLATNPDIQKKLQAEVDEVCDGMDENDQLKYEQITELEYLDMVLNESMRLSPIGFAAERVCSKEVTMSNGVKIDKGQRVQFLSCGLHTDEKYWSNPQKFDPERFSKENKKKINPYTFIPFGVGPRNCIGMRFALMEVKVAMFHTLRNFNLEPSEKTPIPIKYDSKSFNVAINGGNNLRLVPRT